MNLRRKRLTFVAIGAVMIAAALALILSAFEESIVFFRSPSDIAQGAVKGDERFRLGGLVEDGSVDKGSDGKVAFRVTDTVNTVNVTYTGILPDLFREGQGVVTEGRLRNGVFVADEVLAKHDETYMPPEVAEALKQAGQWKGENAADTENAY